MILLGCLFPGANISFFSIFFSASSQERGRPLMALTSSLAQLRAFLRLSNRPSAWKLLFLIYAFLNLKNLPGAWHVRVFYAFISQIYRTRGPLPPTTIPATLFQPLIIRTRPSLYECDWNIHKSNSTYFSDFDVARSHLVTWICRRGLANLRREIRASVGVMLGGAHCSFRREIKPYQLFEIWTRVLSWDRKWLYIISHFVKKGEVQPKGWTLQPGRGLERKHEGVNGHANGNVENEPTQPHPTIYASAIAKYVFKKGRLTIPPSRVLQGSGLLPPKPEETSTPDNIPSPTPNGQASAPRGTLAVEEQQSLEPAEDLIDAAFTAPSGQAEEWNWQRVEDERVRGLKLAEMFNGLDGLSGEFRGGEDDALGIFADPF